MDVPGEKVGVGYVGEGKAVRLAGNSDTITVSLDEGVSSSKAELEIYYTNDLSLSKERLDGMTSERIETVDISLTDSNPKKEIVLDEGYSVAVIKPVSKETSYNFPHYERTLNSFQVIFFSAVASGVLFILSSFSSKTKDL